MSDAPAVIHTSSRTRIFGKARRFLFITLTALLALCLVFSWYTRGTTAQLAYLRAQNRAGGQSIVSIKPWRTAHTLAANVATYQEARYAREAEQLAAHEVDQAFSAALRSADLKMRHRTLTGRALTLSQHVAQLQQEILQDRAAVKRLKTQSAAPVSSASAAANSAASSDNLQVAQAQLGLDTDQLTDARYALERATGNLSFRIKNELAAHEATLHKYNRENAAGEPLTVHRVYDPGILAGRLRIWFTQRHRIMTLQKAHTEALDTVHSLTKNYDRLEAQANAEAKASSTPASLSQIQDRRTRRQILYLNGDRIRTNQQLANIYAKWGSLVLLQHHLIFHLIIQSFEAILIIILFVILGDAAINRLITLPSHSRRQTQTLHTILKVGLRCFGVFLIALVIFGSPHHSATIFGLITAALTIALQDYILAFFGWFSLTGKHGIRVGDLVEINDVCGEVIEIGLMSTTLLETTGLREKGEPTGRRVSFLNGFAIRGTYFNFSGEGQWLWDEITIAVPSSADIYAIAKSVEEAARQQTAESARRAEQEWNRHQSPTSLNRVSAAPVVMMRPSISLVDLSTSIDIQVRYVTHAAGRYEVRDRLYRHVIQMLKEQKHLAPPPQTTPALP